MVVEADTIKLLKECNSGCKMAINSIRQVKGYAEKESLLKLLDEYEKKHEKLENKISALLKEYGREKEEPDKIASAFSLLTAEVKLMIKKDSSQIAKLMTDGCNMGIQSLSEYINKYPAASGESISLAKDLVKAEETFMKELRKFL